jgi:AcrR family transcriptional regulator
MQKASERSKTATPTSKEPRTERGRRTLRAILDAAAAEFGERGFHETGITHITQRAGVALGTFYTYFDSKEEVFRALVKDMSGRVSQVGAQAVEGVTGTLAAERAVLAAFVAFASAHKELYRIIDEAEFVEPEAWRAHYEGAALRIRTRRTARRCWRSRGLGADGHERIPGPPLRSLGRGHGAGRGGAAGKCAGRGRVTCELSNPLVPSVVEGRRHSIRAAPLDFARDE